MNYKEKTKKEEKEKSNYNSGSEKEIGEIIKASKETKFDNSKSKSSSESKSNSDEENDSQNNNNIVSEERKEENIIQHIKEIKNVKIPFEKLIPKNQSGKFLLVEKNKASTTLLLYSRYSSIVLFTAFLNLLIFLI